MSGQLHRVLACVGGAQVAYTNTSRIEDGHVERAIRALAHDIDLHRVVVHVKRMGARRRTLGRAYPTIPAIANLAGLRTRAWRYLIVVTDIDFLDTLAHEAKHIEQFRQGRRGSEPPCYAFSAWAVPRMRARMAGRTLA